MITAEQARAALHCLGGNGDSSATAFKSAFTTLAEFIEQSATPSEPASAAEDAIDEAALTRLVRR